MVVCGWTPGRHAATFGSLVLGVHEVADGRLRYVGTGFTEQTRGMLRGLLDERGRAEDPFDEPVPAADVAITTRAEVRYVHGSVRVRAT